MAGHDILCKKTLLWPWWLGVSDNRQHVWLMNVLGNMTAGVGLCVHRPEEVTACVGV